LGNIIPLWWQISSNPVHTNTTPAHYTSFYCYYVFPYDMFRSFIRPSSGRGYKDTHESVL